MRTTPTSATFPVSAMLGVAAGALIWGVAGASPAATPKASTGARDAEADEPARRAASTASREDSEKPDDEATRKTAARRAFQKGTKDITEFRWAEALASFEEAQALAPHPITLYNIGFCLQGMGRYTAARDTWRKTLVAHEKKVGGRELPRQRLEDTRGYLRAVEKAIARVTVTVTPATAKLAIDGRPLSWVRGKDARWKPVSVEARRTRDPRPEGIPSPEVEGARARAKAKAGTAAERTTAIAGLRAPGPGEVPRAETFVLELDPGSHVVTISRKGFGDQVVRRDFRPGPNPPLDLQLDQLPATISVDANVDGALVFLGERDLGPAPVVVRRPAGAYELRVERDGFETYRSQLEVRAGEDAILRADLAEDEPLIVEQWWFWTAAAVVVAGAAVGTYFLVRDDPDPIRQPVDGGSLGVEFETP